VRLLSALDRFFSETVPLEPGDGLLVAYSGGPDSTALLWGLEQLRASRGFELGAAHVDHAIDLESAHRAEAALQLGKRIGVEVSIERCAIDERERRRRGLEAAARLVRYRALEQRRSELGARYIATAHHRDDQIETVLLRLMQGSGWEGLAGIPERNDRLVRPLLGLGRAELEEELGGTGGARLRPVADPTNTELAQLRNRLRQHLLPYLEGVSPGIGGGCVRLGASAAAARGRVEAALRPVLEPRATADRASISLAGLRALPPSLLPSAAALLHRTAGADYPPPLSAVAELARQLREGGRIGGDCGGQWRWEESGERLWLRRRSAPVADFSYRLAVPGAVDLAEISLRLKVVRTPVASWMFRGSPTRTGLGPALRQGDSIVVRNRRPGDRLRPLGCSYTRRLKDVLIDRQIPRDLRDRIPLLCVGDQIAWVPGVTIDDDFRIGDEEQAWCAQLEPTEESATA
jgi:tRNA(Ile)-lysidine synthase